MRSGDVPAGLLGFDAWPIGRVQPTFPTDKHILILGVATMEITRREALKTTIAALAGAGAVSGETVPPGKAIPTQISAAEWCLMLVQEASECARVAHLEIGRMHNSFDLINEFDFIAINRAEDYLAHALVELLCFAPKSSGDGIRLDGEALASSYDCGASLRSLQERISQP